MKTITKELMSFLESTTSITGGSIYDTTVSDKFGGRYEAIVLSWCSFSYETGPDYCDWRKFESIVKNVGFERWGNVSEEHDETQYEGRGSVVFILTESYKDPEFPKQQEDGTWVDEDGEVYDSMTEYEELHFQEDTWF